jgi:voltage-dependent anion channel protein 2
MAFRPVLFKDLVKRSDDLLTKEFPSDKSENKLEWKGEEKNNISQDVTLTQKSDGSILGVFAPKYKYKEYGATFTGELRTNREFKVEVGLEDMFSKVKGLKTTLSAETKGEDLVDTLSVEYKHDYAAASTSFDYGQSNGSTIKASAVVGISTATTSGIQLGTSVDYFLGSNSDSILKEIQGQLTYGTPEYDIGVFGKIQNEKDSSILGAKYFQKVNSDLSVASEVSFDTQNADAKPKLSFGSQYRLDADTYVKGRFDTAGKLGLSWNHKVGGNAKLTVAATLDTNNLGAKSASTFGFTLSL